MNNFKRGGRLGTPPQFKGPETTGRMRTLTQLPFGASITRLDEGTFADPRHRFAYGGGSALPPPPPQEVIQSTNDQGDTVYSSQTINTFNNQSAARAGRPEYVVRSMMVSIFLIPGEPQILLNENIRRVGCQIQNLDANVVAANLFYAFGVQTTASQTSPGNAFQLSPGGIALYDFTTPVDVIWGSSFGAVPSQVTLVEFTKVYL